MSPRRRRLAGRLAGERTRLASLLGVPLLLVLALGMLLAGCAGSENDQQANLDVPASPEEANSVVVRISGTEGIPFSGTYGTIEGELQTVDDSVGAQPTEYEVEVQEGVFDGVTAGFQKSEPGQGELKVAIVADDQVVVESRTLAEFGAVNADWFPQMGPPEEMPLEEEMILPEDEVIPPEDEGGEVTSAG